MSRKSEITPLMPFDQQAFDLQLEGFSNTQEGTVVTTTVRGKVAKTTNFSDRYFNFPLIPYINRAMEAITAQGFPIRTFNVHFWKAMQEIRLFGDEIQFLGETYRPVFNILNSTDGTRSVEMSVGLYRTQSGTQYVMPTSSSIAIRGKHFQGPYSTRFANLEGVIEKAYEGIGSQFAILAKLQQKTVSVKDILNHLSPNKTNCGKLDFFLRKIQTSPTDGIEITDPQEKIRFETPAMNLDFNSITTTLSATKAFNLYMEVFRNRDSATIHREVKRILNILEIVSK